MALDDYDDNGDDPHTRFGEVRLVVRQATGQQYAAKTIQARLVCLVVNKLNDKQDTTVSIRNQRDSKNQLNESVKS